MIGSHKVCVSDRDHTQNHVSFHCDKRRQSNRDLNDSGPLTIFCNRSDMCEICYVYKWKDLLGMQL